MSLLVKRYYISQRHGVPHGTVNLLNLCSLKSIFLIFFIFFFIIILVKLSRKIAPIFENLSKDYPDIKFVKVDVDQVQEAAAINQINSVPTFKFLYNDTTVKSVSLLGCYFIRYLIIILFLIDGWRR